MLRPRTQCPTPDTNTELSARTEGNVEKTGMVVLASFPMLVAPGGTLYVYGAPKAYMRVTEWILEEFWL